MKRVSVVIPNYNCGIYLDKCLRNLVEQTYTNLEIIVCDDASTDQSLDVIHGWMSKDARICLLKNETNLGTVKTYNKGYFAAKGEYIMVQDADDWSELNRVEKQVAILETYDVGMCVTNYIGQMDVGHVHYPDYGPSMLLDIKSKEVWGATPSLMFRRSVLNEIPGYPSYFDRMAGFDRYFIMEILDKYKGYYLNEYLYNWVMRPNSDHRTINLDEPRALAKMISNDIYLELKRQRIETGTDWVKDKDWAAIKNFEQKLLSDNNFIADKIRVFACIQIDYGNYEEGKRLLFSAIKRSPFFIKNYSTLLYYLKAKYLKTVNTSAPK